MKAWVLAAALAAGSLPAPVADVKLKVGDPAPDFEAEWLDHETKKGSLSDLRGRVVLIEFWRTW